MTTTEKKKYLTRRQAQERWGVVATATPMVAPAKR
jgi:hypothetical protein